MIRFRHIAAAMSLIAAVLSCGKGNDPVGPGPDPGPDPDPVAPAFRFYVNNLEFTPGQAARIAFKHEGVSITSSTLPSGWSLELDASSDVIGIVAPDASGKSFASGGVVRLNGTWNGKNLVSNELNVRLLGINTQDDWNCFCEGKTEGYIVDGELYLNCDVTATKSVQTLSVPFEAHGHTVTLDIAPENSSGGLFGTVQKDVRNLCLDGSVSTAADGDDAGCASLAARCADGVRIENVSSSADVTLDFQTRHLGKAALSGIVSFGAPVLENCVFTGRMKALNCDAGQDVSFLKDAEVDIPTGCFSLRQLKITTDQIGNSYILRTEGGKVVVFDGGSADQADNLLKNINTYYGGKIDEWWISHAHGDHMGAFNKIVGAADHLPVGKVVYSKVPDKILAVESGSQGSLISVLKKYEAAGGTVVDLRKAGERFEIDGVFIKVLGIATDDFPQLGSPYPSPINNSSVIIRVWDREKSVIFLGDAQELKGAKVLAEYRPYMHCDYLQMGHHGNWTCGKSFYDAVDFKAALWPTPTFLWTCKSGNGSGWDCWKYRAWVAAKGVTENHASCQGDWLLEMGTKL